MKTTRAVAYFDQHFGANFKSQFFGKIFLLYSAFRGEKFKIWRFRPVLGDWSAQHPNAGRKIQHRAISGCEGYLEKFQKLYNSGKEWWGYWWMEVFCLWEPNAHLTVFISFEFFSECQCGLGWSLHCGPLLHVLWVQALWRSISLLATDGYFFGVWTTGSHWSPYHHGTHHSWGI